MLTVKGFKGLGLEFVVGDEYNDSEVFVEIIPEGIPYSGQLKTDCGIYSDIELYMLVPSSFAWRPIATLPTTLKYCIEINADKSMWRPLLGQSQPVEIKYGSSVLDETLNAIEQFNLSQLNSGSERIGVMSNGDVVKLVAANDDKPIFTPWSETYSSDKLPKLKPVFTQAMADKGELPPVGSECTLRYMHDSKTLTRSGVVAYASKKYCILNQVGAEVMHKIGDYSYEVLDTRTPKQKAVDDIVKVLHSEGVVAFDPIMLHIMYEKGFIKC